MAKLWWRREVMREFSVIHVPRDEWACGLAHDLCYQHTFNALRSKEMDRCNFALIVCQDKKPCGFVTCIEMDSETVYWQWGGAFDFIKRSISVIESYLTLISKIKEMGFKRITTRIENTNITMLKLAMRCGFLINGTWNLNGKIYLELVNSLGAV